MGRHGTDDEVVAVHLDALELGDGAEVDEVRRLRQALFHRGEQGLTAGQELGIGAAGCLGGVGHRGRTEIVEVVHAVVLPYSAAALTLLMACHTRWGEAGMVMSVTPSGASASSTALITAGGEPMAPTSPQPFEPSGLWVHIVLWVETLNEGTLSARGMV